MVKFKTVLRPRSTWIGRHNTWATVGPWLSERDSRLIVIWMANSDNSLSTIVGIRIMGLITRNTNPAIWLAVEQNVYEI